MEVGLRSLIVVHFLRWREADGGLCIRRYLSAALLEVKPGVVWLRSQDKADAIHRMHVAGHWMGWAGARHSSVLAAGLIGGCREPKQI